MHLSKYINRTITSVVMAVFAVAAFTGCSDSDDPVPVVEISLRKDNVTATEREQFLTVKADGSWEISFKFEDEEDNEDPWCYVSEADRSGAGNRNNIILKYSENYSAESRSVDIILSSGTAEDRVTLTQEGNPEVGQVRVILRKQEVPANDISQLVTVISNSDWNLALEYPVGSPSGWASVAPLSGTGIKTDVVLSYSANETDSDRSVDVVVFSTDRTERARARMTQKARTGQEAEIVEIELSSETVAYTAATQTVNVKCEGAWTLAAEYPAGTAQWVTIGTPGGTGNKTVSITYGQNDGAAERKATIVLRSVATGGEDRAALTQSGKPAVTVPSGWLELPDLSGIGSDEMFVTHNTTIGGRRVRNYSMLYDTKENIAYWVAYPHHTSYLGDQSRTNAWAYDPIVPRTLQANLSSGFGTGSGYDRGHQIPSGDRTSDRETNKQTFYYTNMTPQLSRFNQDKWAKLEGQVRGWLKDGSNRPDTLYVVTGAVLRTAGGAEKVEYMTKGDKKVAIPNYYYKVLLYRKGSIYSSIGFWYTHANHGNTDANRSETKTVREIERLTGFDFFSNLPREIQDNIEDVIDFSIFTGL